MSFRSRLPDHIPPGAWLIIAAALLWHAPSIALDRVRFLAARVRFEFEMLVVDALAILGRKRTARRLLARVILRNRRLIRAERTRAPRPHR